MNWIPLNEAQIQADFPTDLLPLYNQWVADNPAKAGRLAAIIERTAQEFRDSILSNPSNFVDPDPVAIPTSCLRHAETIVFYNLMMEMGLSVKEEAQESNTRADMFLRQITYKHFKATAEDSEPSPHYEVPENATLRTLPALLITFHFLLLTSAFAGWVDSSQSSGPLYSLQEIDPVWSTGRTAYLKADSFMSLCVVTNQSKVWHPPPRLATVDNVYTPCLSFYSLPQSDYSSTGAYVYAPGSYVYPNPCVNITVRQWYDFDPDLQIPLAAYYGLDFNGAQIRNAMYFGDGSHLTNLAAVSSAGGATNAVGTGGLALGYDAAAGSITGTITTADLILDNYLARTGGTMFGSINMSDGDLTTVAGIFGSNGRKIGCDDGVIEGAWSFATPPTGLTNLLPLAGGTMSGPLTNGAEITAMQYLVFDTAEGGYTTNALIAWDTHLLYGGRRLAEYDDSVQKAGDTMTGALRFRNLTYPARTASVSAAKGYNYTALILEGVDSFVCSPTNLYAQGDYEEIAIGANANATSYGVALGALDAGYGGVQAQSGGVGIGMGTRASTEGVGVGIRAWGSSYGVGVGSRCSGSTYGVAVGSYAQGYTYGVGVGANAAGYDVGASVGYLSKGFARGAALGAAANGSQTNVAIGYFANANGGSFRTAIGAGTSNLVDNSALIRGSLYLDGATTLVFRSTFGAGDWNVGLQTETGRLYSINADGTRTLISPHDDAGATVMLSENPYAGERTIINLERMALALQSLGATGLIERVPIPKRDWDEEQQARASARLAEIATWDKARAAAIKAADAWDSLPVKDREDQARPIVPALSECPILYKPIPCPAWIRARNKSQETFP